MNYLPYDLSQWLNQMQDFYFGITAFVSPYLYCTMEEKESVKGIDKKKKATGFSLQNRKPAYVAAALILISLLLIYLLNVYHNKHETASPLPPKTMTKPAQ